MPIAKSWNAIIVANKFVYKLQAEKICCHFTSSIKMKKKKIYINLVFIGKVNKLLSQPINLIMRLVYIQQMNFQVPSSDIQFESDEASFPIL